MCSAAISSERTGGGAMEAEWTALIEKAKTLEVGDILECDERQWRIELDT